MSLSVPEFQAIDPDVYRRYRRVLYAAAIAMMGFVFVTGAAIRGSRRWIDLGFFRLQPSELGKVLLILFLAGFLADRTRRIENPKTILAAVGLAALPVFGGPRQRRQLGRWLDALDAARRLPDDQLPSATGPAGDGVPPTARWREREPDAADRLARAREVVTVLAEEHTVLAQNLLASDVVRRLAWQPPQPLDEAGMRERMAELGARPWQVELTAAPLVAALT